LESLLSVELSQYLKRRDVVVKISNIGKGLYVHDAGGLARFRRIIEYTNSKLDNNIIQ